MKKYILFVLGIFTLAIIQSCTECPITTQDPVFLCETRIVTIEKFNPNFTVVPGSNGASDTVVLDPDYNIGIYQFPLNSSSTGSFPNDSRFTDAELLPVASVPFVENNTLYYANFMDSYPTNENMVGDILVREVDLTTNPPNALLRFAGSIQLFDVNYLNEDAQAFCDYVKAQQGTIADEFGYMTQQNLYGKNQAGAITTNYDTNPVVISDKNGKIIGTVGQAGVPNPPTSTIDELRNLAGQKNSIDLSVVPGNVYLYIAKNGKRFIFFITELRESNIIPFRKRASIMFYPLDK